MVLCDKEISMIRDKYEQLCYKYGLASDLFDFEAELDRSLTYWEAWGEIEDKVSSMLHVFGMENQNKPDTSSGFKAISSAEINCDDNKPVCILGNTNSGKTNLMVYIARNCNRIKYLLGYPKHIKGFRHLSSMTDLRLVRDCVVCIDEVSRFIKIYDNKSNMGLIELIQFAEHNNIKLIFNTQLSQFVTKMMEAMIPQWAILDMDISSLKNGSKPKRILFDGIAMPQIVNKSTGLKIDSGQFIWWNDKAKAGENGLKNYPYQNIGKDWAN